MFNRLLFNKQRRLRANGHETGKTGRVKVNRFRHRALTVEPLGERLVLSASSLFADFDFASSPGGFDAGRQHDGFNSDRFDSVAPIAFDGGPHHAAAPESFTPQRGAFGDRTRDVFSPTRVDSGFADWQRIPSTYGDMHEPGPGPMFGRSGGMDFGGPSRSIAPLYFQPDHRPQPLAGRGLNESFATPQLFVPPPLLVIVDRSPPPRPGLNLAANLGAGPSSPAASPSSTAATGDAPIRLTGLMQPAGITYLNLPEISDSTTPTTFTSGKSTYAYNGAIGESSPGSGSLDREDQQNSSTSTGSRADFTSRFSTSGQRADSGENNESGLIELKRRDRTSSRSSQPSTDVATSKTFKKDAERLLRRLIEELTAADQPSSSADESETALPENLGLMATADSEAGASRPDDPNGGMVELRVSNEPAQPLPASAGSQYAMTAQSIDDVIVTLDAEVALYRNFELATGAGEETGMPSVPTADGDQDSSASTAEEAHDADPPAPKSASLSGIAVAAAVLSWQRRRNTRNEESLTHFSRTVRV